VVILLNRAAGDRRPYAPLAEHLARHRIASLRLDLRAHGESTNLGTFDPAAGAAILAHTDHDVSAAQRFLAADKRFDPGHVGFVGASYSGEAMMQAAKVTGYGAAYVGLSPGSLSDESIAAIDRERLPWLLVVSRHERHLKEVAQALRDGSRLAQFLELDGTEHGTGILTAHPGLDEILAVWFENAFARRARDSGGARDRE
jgi:dienelactone hydrolase